MELLVGIAILSPSAEGQQRPPDAYYSDDTVLGTLIEEAILQNPGLARSLARYRSALQRIPQVKALPEPMFTYTQFVRSIETRVGPQRNSFVLSQQFPWFGKLDLKAQVELKEALALLELHAGEQDEVVLQLKQAYYELGYIDRALRITEEERILLSQYERLAQARYAAGEGRQQGVLKIQTELSRTLDRTKLLVQQREYMVTRLNTLRDTAPDAPIPSVAIGSLPAVRLDAEELYRLAEASRPELRAVEARVQKNEKAIELAKKDFWPDLTAGFGYTNVGGRTDLAPGMLPTDNGKDAYLFSVGVRLPIWRQKYRAGVLEATERLLSDRRDYLSLRNQLEASVRDQSIRLNTLKEQIELFQTLLIPQAEASLRSTETAYQTGLVGVLDLLDGERMLLQLRLTTARYRVDYFQSLAAMERALGTQFP